MDPQAWVESVRGFSADGDWDSLNRLRLDTNQGFATRSDDAGLREFYRQAAALALSAKEREAIGDTGAERFQAALAAACAAARERTVEGAAKGVYVEYFFDGGDACTINLFLCTDYSESDDAWGAECAEDGFIEGPEVPAFFRFDPGLDWPDFARCVAEEHANGLLLAAVIREWTRSGVRGIPLGFARHDQEMVRVPALTG